MEEVLELATHISVRAAPHVRPRRGLVFCMTDTPADHSMITTVEGATTFVFQEIPICLMLKVATEATFMEPNMRHLRQITDF